MNNIFFEKSTNVIDEVGGLKWSIDGPPTLGESATFTNMSNEV